MVASYDPSFAMYNLCDPHLSYVKCGRDSLSKRPTCVCRLSHFSHVRLFATLWTVDRQAPSMDSPGKNTGVGCYALLQGIFLTQGSNPYLLCLLLWQGCFFFFFFFLTTSATWEAPKAHNNYYIRTYTVLSFSLYIQWLTYNIEKCSPSELVNENIFFVLIENYISKKKLCSSWQHGS